MVIYAFLMKGSVEMGNGNTNPNMILDKVDKMILRK